jgi:CRISPR-associated endonuclease Cas2
MNVIQISYDLTAPESRKDYARLILAIHSLGTVERVQYSLWVLKTTKTEAQVRDFLRSFIDENDSLFITKIDGYASYNVPNAATNLINKEWNNSRLSIPVPRANLTYKGIQKRLI